MKRTASHVGSIDPQALFKRHHEIAYDLLGRFGPINTGHKLFQGREMLNRA